MSGHKSGSLGGNTDKFPLISDGTHANPEDALLAALRKRFTVVKVWERVQETCALYGIEVRQIGDAESVSRAFTDSAPPAAHRLLRHRPVQQLLAVQRLADEIEQDRATYSLVRSWPGDLRGALYTPQQRDDFTRCGAILEDRVPG